MKQDPPDLLFLDIEYFKRTNLNWWVLRLALLKRFEDDVDDGGVGFEGRSRTLNKLFGWSVTKLKEMFSELFFSLERTWKVENDQTQLKYVQMEW